MQELLKHKFETDTDEETVESVKVDDFDVEEVLRQVMLWAPMFSSQLTGGKVSQELALLLRQAVLEFKVLSSDPDEVNPVILMQEATINLKNGDGRG